MPSHRYTYIFVSFVRKQSKKIKRKTKDLRVPYHSSEMMMPIYLLSTKYYTSRVNKWVYRFTGSTTNEQKITFVRYIGGSFNLYIFRQLYLKDLDLKNKTKYDSNKQFKYTIR